MSRSDIVKNPTSLKKVLNREPYHRRAVDFIQSFDRYKTPQGSDYWESRYYRLYEIDEQIKNPTFTLHVGTKIEMSERDWEYLSKLITPDDPFLLDKKNKKYVT